jgi:uncharacterized protein (DUF2141 family)
MRVLLILVTSLLLFKCARQSQPSGGPKDTDPPELTSSNPQNGQKNFKGNQLELTLDEPIKLKDPKEEIFITPSMGSNTKFTVKNNRLFIYPEYKLKDSTTYSIAFRDAVQDMNEGNPAEDLHLAFSTGSTIDSLKVSGSVTEVFKEKVPEKITVALYQSDTFDIFKHKPILFTKSDKAGKFSITNLKPGQYFVYAFEDKNKNQKVDSKTEKFGFVARSLNLTLDIDSVNIELIHLDARPIKLTSIRNSSTVSVIRFNKAVDSINLRTEKPIIYTYGDTRSEIIIYKDKELDQGDSLRVSVFAKDSINQKIDTAVYAKFTDNKYIDDKFKITNWEINFEPSSKKLIAVANTNKLLLSINLDSIYIQIDTSSLQPITPKEIFVDTIFKKITLKTILKIDPSNKTPKPIILFGKGAFVSINNDSSKSQDVKIKIAKSEETGTVLVEVKTKEPHFIVRLTTPDDKLVKSFSDQKRYTFVNIEPGDYKICVIIDSNNNGRWDPGNFFKKEQPEKIKLYKTLENKFSFPVRANWELGPLLISF